MNRVVLEPNGLDCQPLYLGEDRQELMRSQGKRALPLICQECGSKVRASAAGYGVCRECGNEVGE